MLKIIEYIGPIGVGKTTEIQKRIKKEKNAFYILEGSEKKDIIRKVTETLPFLFYLIKNIDKTIKTIKITKKLNYKTSVSIIYRMYRCDKTINKAKREGYEKIYFCEGVLHRYISAISQNRITYDIEYYETVIKEYYKKYKNLKIVQVVKPIEKIIKQRLERSNPRVDRKTPEEMEREIKKYFKVMDSIK